MVRRLFDVFPFEVKKAKAFHILCSQTVKNVPSFFVIKKVQGGFNNAHIQFA